MIRLIRCISGIRVPPLNLDAVLRAPLGPVAPGHQPE